MGLIYGGKTYGDDCLLCFGEGYTPKYIMASFDGISPTSWIPPLPPNPPYPDPNITVQLEQVFGAPCTWQGYNGYWFCKYEVYFGISTLSLWAILPWVHAFYCQLPAQCRAGFQNGFVDPVNWTFYGGSGQIASI